MGLLFSRLYDLYQSLGTTPARIAMLGLDNAGKTTILYKIKLNEAVATIPTIGFNVETVEPVKGVSFTVWDVGGQDKIRPLWRQFLYSNDGLVYVVDSSDRERVTEAAAELHSMLAEDTMYGVPVVVLANKQDLPAAMAPSELIQRMGLRKITTSQWHVQGTCAKRGDGVYEGLDLLAAMVKEFKRKHNR